MHGYFCGIYGCFYSRLIRRNLAEPPVGPVEGQSYQTQATDFTDFAEFCGQRTVIFVKSAESVAVLFTLDPQQFRLGEGCAGSVFPGIPVSEPHPLEDHRTSGISCSVP